MGVVVPRDAGDDGDLALEFGGGWRGGGPISGFGCGGLRRGGFGCGCLGCRGSWRGGVVAAGPGVAGSGGRFWRRSVGGGRFRREALLVSARPWQRVDRRRPGAARGAQPRRAAGLRRACLHGRAGQPGRLTRGRRGSRRRAASRRQAGSAAGGVSAAGGAWRRGRLDGGGLRGGPPGEGLEALRGELVLGVAPGRRTGDWSGTPGGRGPRWPLIADRRGGGGAGAADTGGAGGCCGPAGRAGG